MEHRDESLFLAPESLSAVCNGGGGGVGSFPTQTQSLAMEYISADIKSWKLSFYLKHAIGGDSAFNHAKIMKLPT